MPPVTTTSIIDAPGERFRHQQRVRDHGELADAGQEPGEAQRGGAGPEHDRITGLDEVERQLRDGLLLVLQLARLLRVCGLVGEAARSHRTASGAPDHARRGKRADIATDRDLRRAGAIGQLLHRHHAGVSDGVEDALSTFCDEHRANLHASIMIGRTSIKNHRRRRPSPRGDDRLAVRHARGYPAREPAWDPFRPIAANWRAGDLPLWALFRRAASARTRPGALPCLARLVQLGGRPGIAPAAGRMAGYGAIDEVRALKARV